MYKRIIIVWSAFFLLSFLHVEASDVMLDIYRVQPDNLNNHDVLKRGTLVNAVLLNNISTNENQQTEPLSFNLFDSNGQKINASGNIVRSTSPGRFSKHGSLVLSTSKIILNDGQEIKFTATSPVFKALHPPHADTSSLALAQAVTSLSWAATPLTFGTSLGISFLVGGLLSAYQNGISDFIWGGFNGSRFSFLENLFRKQPDLFLPTSATIPFTLNSDVKISKGLQKENIEKTNISKEEAINKIQTLLKWGDLTGALEFSIRTDNIESYDEIMKKISLL